MIALREVFREVLFMPVPSLWRIKKAVHEFKLRLLKAQGDNVLKIVVFGSVAREEHKEGSDIDIFVLLKESDRVNIGENLQVTSIATNLNIEKARHDIYISPFILTKEEYDAGKKSSLVLFNIRDEGVVLYDIEG
jgi:predicted nucleotidyltransferase